MVFSGGVLDPAGAEIRFDHMLELAAELSYAKRPIVERSTALVVGYTGVDRFEFEGASELEFGWRLVPSARGVGYVTEAAAHVECVVLELVCDPEQCVGDVTGSPFAAGVGSFV